MAGLQRRLMLVVVLLAWVVTDASAQYTIQRRQKQQQQVAEQEESKHNPYEAFGGFVGGDLTNDYYDHAAWLAERRRIRKERNTFEFEAKFSTSALQFENWTAGGNNTFSGLTTLYMRHQYKRNKFSSDLKVNTRYGINFIDNVHFKNVDELKIEELMSWSFRKSWSYSAKINFRTQLTDGFASRTDRTLISALMSPGFADVSVGFTYAPAGAPYKLTLSPLAGNVITMLDERLYEKGSNGVPAGKKFYSGVGPSINASFDRTFFAKKWLRYRSTLYGFYALSNLKEPPTCRWDNWIDIALSKYLSVNLYGVVYYLHSASPKAQYQYSATLGLSYRFKNK